MPPPGRGNGSDPELLDSPIGLFHYPSPGALLRLLGHFIFNIRCVLQDMPVI